MFSAAISCEQCEPDRIDWACKCGKTGDGFVVSSWLFSAILFLGLGNSARTGELTMKVDSLKNCIATLVDIRNTYNGQLDTSVVTRLDEIISELQSLEKKDVEVNVYDIGTKTLQIIADILSVVTKFTDLL
jgi:hypothetical protein